MIIIRGRNIQQILPDAMYRLRVQGVERGGVVMFPEPVTTVYERPDERVCFWAERNADPFYQLFAALRMLNGAEWRSYFGFDQLSEIVRILLSGQEPVLSMWDPREGNYAPKDLQAIFNFAQDGRLDMTVTNRSSDMLWGAYGASVVKLSYLHEFVARAVDVSPGVLRHVCASLHARKEELAKVMRLSDVAYDGIWPRNVWLRDPYQKGLARPFPLMTLPWEEWLEELKMFLSDPFAIGFKDPFFRRVAIPMMRAHKAYFDKSDTAIRLLKRGVYASDWKLAGIEWIERGRTSERRGTGTNSN